MKILKYGVLLLFLSVLSCGGDANSYSIEMQDNDVPTMIGSTNNLMWQMEDEEDYNTAFHKMDNGQASTFCANLEYAGFSDWRLATIDELRTIVAGYSSLLPSGSCKIKEKCAMISCSTDSCNNNDQDPAEGPGEGGCFWDAVWGEKYCGIYWSSTDVVSGDDSMAWLFDYKFPAIVNRVKASSSALAYVRCVREM